MDTWGSRARNPRLSQPNMHGPMTYPPGSVPAVNFGLPTSAPAAGQTPSTPVYGGQSWGSYFLPGYNYSAPGQDMSGSGIADYLQRQNWQIAYDYWSQGAGLSPNSLFAQFVRSQEPLTQRAFNAALVSNPDLTPQTFLNQYGPNLQNTFNALPYQLRGENPSAWGQGRTQWVRRNN